ncbi:MAG: 23S rRNA (guanosine(2251)-2'-O)-methyltransferase RlmB [Clostridiaceae bacterium]|nr:23S rRNA (guanosine(2251)-2'-O)-methyltransferase RlmB [Clostridiaceae bacterium]
MGRKRNENRKYNGENINETGGATGRLEGRNPILEALKAEHTINRIYIEKGLKDPVLEKIYAVARSKGIVVSYLDKAGMNQMSETRNHQGVIADVSPYSYAEVEDILKKAEDMAQLPLIFILDGITDPNNLGSIIRTAECAGVHGIIIPKRRSAAMTPVVAKVAAGAAEHILIARVANLTGTIRDLKEKGLWIAGADMEGETRYYDYDYQSPLAVVIGSEGEGISRLVRENCDILLRIPMYGEINSLNAAVAVALIAFRAAEKRGGAQTGKKSL